MPMFCSSVKPQCQTPQGHHFLTGASSTISSNKKILVHKQNCNHFHSQINWTLFRYKIKTEDVKVVLVLKATRVNRGDTWIESESDKWDMWSVHNTLKCVRPGSYHCDVCDNMFTSPDNITDHKKTYHESARLNTVNSTKC